MATANDIVSGALRLLGVTAAGEVPAASEAADGLAALNQMLHAWPQAGINLEWSDVALSDVLPVPDSHLKAIRYNLAIEAAPEFGVAPSVLVIEQAAETRRALEAIYCNPPTLTVDPTLRWSPDTGWDDL